MTGRKAAADALHFKLICRKKFKDFKFLLNQL